MPSEELLGGAFFEIGGKTTKLKAALDSSFRMTQQSLAQMADMAKQFGPDLGQGFDWAAKALTGPGGFVAALAEALSSLVSIEQVSARLRQNLAMKGQTPAAISGILEGLGEQARGTPYTARQLQRRAVDMLSGVPPQELGEALELAIGAAHKLNISLSDAANRVAAIWKGGDLSLLDIAGTGIIDWQMRMDRMKGVLVPAAEVARLAYKDPMTGAIQEHLARMSDAMMSAMGGSMRRLLGGYSPEQQALIAQQAKARETGLGPSALARGYSRTGMLDPATQAVNAAEVAAILAQTVGKPSPGRIGDVGEALDKLAGHVTNAAEGFGMLVDALGKVPGKITEAYEYLIPEAVRDTLAEGRDAAIRDIYIDPAGYMGQPGFGEWAKGVLGWGPGGGQLRIDEYSFQEAGGGEGGQISPDAVERIADVLDRTGVGELGPGNRMTPGY